MKNLRGRGRGGMRGRGGRGGGRGRGRGKMGGENDDGDGMFGDEMEVGHNSQFLHQTKLIQHIQCSYSCGNRTEF